MDILHIIILSFVEGITEFLPISSTGHLILTSKILNISQTEFTKSFEIAIQSGAILAVVALYAKRLLRDSETLKRVAIAFIPTGILGLITYQVIKTYLLGNVSVVLWSLFLGGIAIIALELFFKQKQNKKTINDLSYLQTLGIGIIQSLSFIPGVSRAGATIFGGMFLGLTRKDAVEMSFMLSIPTMFSATFYDLIKNYNNFSVHEFGNLGIGIVVSFIFAYLSIVWLLKFVSHNSFIYFGIYRIIIALLFFFIFLA